MSINSTLKKEGIKVISQLDAFEITKIASTISETIANAFPEHNINQSDLFISIARLNMYIAEMPNDMAMAKYFYKNNSIYFSKDMNLNDLNTLAIHECIHYMQELKNKNGKLLRLGLYNLEGSKHSGMALNEAAVQHMASIATNSPLDTVKYYNMELSTESPDFYPLQTALLNEMIYFTGTYPLYHSTLYSNDVFKNTFILRSSAKAYEQIEKNFDLIFEYEARLSEEVYKLSICSDELKSIDKIKKINSKIADYKSIILEKTLETQNTIILSCFNNELNSIKTLEGVKKFQYDLYNFKHVIITTNNYNFFNEFYIDMMNKLDEKKEFILKYGDIQTLDSLTNELSSIEEKTYGFQFFKRLFSKLKLILEETVRQKEF
jgi:hypothetical protein